MGVLFVPIRLLQNAYPIPERVAQFLSPAPVSTCIQFRFSTVHPWRAHPTHVFFRSEVAAGSSSCLLHNGDPGRASHVGPLRPPTLVHSFPGHYSSCQKNLRSRRVSSSTIDLLYCRGSIEWWLRCGKHDKLTVETLSLARERWVSPGLFIRRDRFLERKSEERKNKQKEKEKKNVCFYTLQWLRSAYGRIAGLYSCTTPCPLA